MQYYRDLLDLFPPETVSVPIILHCLREQVLSHPAPVTPHCTLHTNPTAHCILCSTHCKLRADPHCTLYSAQYTLQSDTGHSAYYTLLTAQSTLHTGQ